MHPWLKENLTCLIDGEKLFISKNNLLKCPKGHSYPCINNIPVMFIENNKPTHRSHLKETMDIVQDKNACLNISQDAVNEYISRTIVGVCGIMYTSLKNKKLPRYPIPYFPLKEPKNRAVLLDIGCNWGRWSISASRKKFLPIGIDPSFKAIQAARKIAHRLGIEAIFIVGDARYLPFRDTCFDVVFSYSTLQHFSVKDTKTTLQEVNRVLKPSGYSMIQMLNAHGIRSRYNYLRRGYRREEASEFEVRYWTPKELHTEFERLIGSTEVLVDGFFSANAQKSDIDILPYKYQCVIRASNIFKKLSTLFPPLKLFADSLYLKSQKR